MMRTATSRFASTVLTVLLCTGLVVASIPACGRHSAPDADASFIQLHQLPRQGQKTYRLIHAGGPFPYEKDRTVFGNRERLLPAMRRGYYREYTVKTLGVGHRGARRIVCGGFQPEQPETCYYTSDHYSSFKRIIEE